MNSPTTRSVLGVEQSRVDVVVLPMAVHLPFVMEAIAHTVSPSSHWELEAGAQDFCPGAGSFTGGISYGALRCLGAKYFLVGHSERRAFFGDSDERIAANVKAVLDGIIPGFFGPPDTKCILCVGETDNERDSGDHIAVVTAQLEKALGGEKLGKRHDRLIIAYEPLWAIGTGRTATPDQADDMHRAIFDWLVQMSSEQTARKCRVIYGGSVKPDNAFELMSMPHIDGALVGGASLDPHDFFKIVLAAAGKQIS